MATKTMITLVFPTIYEGSVSSAQQRYGQDHVAPVPFGSWHRDWEIPINCHHRQITRWALQIPFFCFRQVPPLDPQEDLEAISAPPDY